MALINNITSSEKKGETIAKKLTQSNNGVTTGVQQELIWGTEVPQHWTEEPSIDTTLLTEGDPVKNFKVDTVGDSELDCIDAIQYAKADPNIKPERPPYTMEDFGNGCKKLVVEGVVGCVKLVYIAVLAMEALAGAVTGNADKNDSENDGYYYNN